MAGNNDEITLQPKNGKKHVFFVDVINTVMRDNIVEIGSEKIERIIKTMQDRGYEIVDVKFETPDRGIMRVLIMYQ